MSVVEPNADGKYDCPDCDRVFDTPQGLGAHRARIHGYRRDDQAPVDRHPGVLIADPAKYPQYQQVEEGADTPRDPDELVKEIDRKMRAMQYREATAEFLPFFARELHGRDEVPSDLIYAFLTLYIDVT